ncbi:MAG: cobalamin B12-binding domain-containing protein [Chloroflexi bacterium]|nr:cobalamin B12-binding domain-containing protein [Chloroflexota bacterium]
MPTENEILEKIDQAVVDCDMDAAATWARASLENLVDPLTTLDALTTAIQSVGDSFGSGDLFLPELIGAAEAMSAATAILEREIQARGTKKPQAAVVVIGTVFGDLHSIGKDIVATLLRAAGFEVCDLGINVKAQEFVAAIKRTHADILALSALLTTTAPEQRQVIQALKNEGLRDQVKIMVGGGAITADFSASIGADGYAATAPGAVELARRLITI